MSRRGRRPSEEERALWETVATPWRRNAARLAPEIAPVPAPPAATAAPPALLAPEPFAPATLRPSGRPEPPFRLPSPRPVPPSGLDRATETRLRKGRIEPHAKIDLHGMTAADAHRALAAFLLRSREAGRRLVLVVTGKGGLRDGAPGILRQDAPRWLGAPPLSDIVVNVSAAHPRHGGGGAFYVYLKRRPRD